MGGFSPFTEQACLIYSFHLNCQASLDVLRSCLGCEHCEIGFLFLSRKSMHIVESDEVGFVCSDTSPYAWVAVVIVYVSVEAQFQNHNVS